MNDALPLHFNQSARELDLADSSAKLAGMAKDSAAFRYADLFAGIGGFHAMLDHARRAVCLRLGDRPRGAPDVPAQLGGTAAGVAAPRRQHRHHHGHSG